MAHIQDGHEAWNRVRLAAWDGAFVPILGPDLATDPRFTQAPLEALEKYGQDDGHRASQQNRELGKVLLRQRRLMERLRSVQPDISPTAFWRKLAERRAEEDAPKIETLIRYIQNLSWPGVARAARERDEELPGGTKKPLYDDFLCDVTLLALSLKQAWNGSLENDAVALSAVGPETLLQDAKELTIKKVPFVLVACLEHCRQLLLESQSKRWKEPHGLQLEWVYCKLLLLGSHIFGGPETVPLWQDGPRGITDRDPQEFIDEHAEMIDSLKKGERETGWAMEAQGGPRAKKEEHGFKHGLRLTHVLWVENLVRHVLLAGSRAYRTSGQLAFLLSLDDAVHDIPNMMSGDPFEVGLLHPAEEARFSSGGPEIGEAAGGPDFGGVCAGSEGGRLGVWEHG